MSTPAHDDTWYERSGHVVLAATARPLGAFPSGWRMPGAHNDPSADSRALTRFARAAEAAHLDFVFIGDWLSTGPELELTDPYLLARTEPISTAGYLLAKTRRIGVVATTAIAVSEPYSVARIAASLDRLSSGRFGLNLLLGLDPRAQANFGRADRVAVRHVFDQAEEFVGVLRDLWDSFEPEAFVRDADSGRLLDSTRFAPIDHDGTEFSVAGPLNVLRPPQGQVPLVSSGVSARSRDFAVRHADIYLIAPPSFGDAIEFHRDTRRSLRDAGRAEDALSLLAPLMPIIAPTRAAAWAIYDRLADGVLLEGMDSVGSATQTNRSVSQLLRSIGIPLTSHRLDETVIPTTAGKFNAVGRALLETVRARSGRAVGSRRPVTYRHLLVAKLVTVPIVVGSPQDVADHIEKWFRASAVDGFTILSAYLHEQFDAFSGSVVPILAERGLFRRDYENATLRGHLGRAVPDRVTAAGPERAAPAGHARAACDT